MRISLTVAKSLFHSLTSGQNAWWPSMRRPVGVKWVLLFFRWTRFFSCRVPLSPPFHPHFLMSELFRSVQVGCSRFSRCCHLLVDLSSISRMKVGQAINAVIGTRRLGVCFSFLRMFCLYAATCIVI